MIFWMLIVPLFPDILILFLLPLRQYYPQIYTMLMLGWTCFNTYTSLHDQYKVFQFKFKTKHNIIKPSFFDSRLLFLIPMSWIIYKTINNINIDGNSIKIFYFFHFSKTTFCFLKPCDVLFPFVFRPLRKLPLFPWFLVFEEDIPFCFKSFVCKEKCQNIFGRKCKHWTFQLLFWNWIIHNLCILTGFKWLGHKPMQNKSKKTQQTRKWWNDVLFNRGESVAVLIIQYL